MERLTNISQQLNQNKTAYSPKLPDDVVLCAALRTPLTKSKRGLLKDTTPEILLAHVFKGLVEQTKIDPKNINDVVVGNVLQSGAGVMQSRMAQYLAGFPDDTTTVAINRFCSSGLEAVSMIAGKIKAGHIDVGIGAGVENMSLYDMQASVDPEMISEAVFDHEQARNCMMPMGMTSENVAKKFGITRAQQDAMAISSHKKAALAQEQGRYDSEIVKVSTKVKDKEGNLKDVVVTKDEGIRGATDEKSLSKLKPAFAKDGTTTAGNSSQVTDGAAGVLLARRSVAQKLGLPILAKFVSYAVAGVPPEIMGIGPAYAIPVALEKAGLKMNDIDIFEINEAFASQATYSVEKLGVDLKKLNPKGGAIALGHPLGCTGARQIATLLPELKRTGGRYGVVSMCIGTGMGAAGIFERE